MAPRWSLHSPIISQAGGTLVPGDMLIITWSISGDPHLESCEVALRSLDDPQRVVTEVLPQPRCGSGSSTLVIPNSPLNTTLLYGGEWFVVRINTKLGRYVDTGPVKLATTRPAQPWSVDVAIALAGVIVAGIGVLVPILLYKWRSRARRARRTSVAVVHALPLIPVNQSPTSRAVIYRHGA
ncbi:hypothetical protein BGZ81_003611 [Podila clonocystis]|nr:hypothetical protein BGZ81_003611 [Podila clonocystis]